MSKGWREATLTRWYGGRQGWCCGGVAGEQRDESPAGSTWCSWSVLPFSRLSDAPRGWQAPSLQEGNSLSVGWEKKFKSLPCVLRENKNLSVCIYEKISHLIPAGGKKREKKTHPFLSQAGGCLHTQAGTVGYSTMVWVYPTSHPCQESLNPRGTQHILRCKGLGGRQSVMSGWGRLSAATFGTANDKVPLWLAKRGCCLQNTFSV